MRRIWIFLSPLSRAFSDYSMRNLSIEVRVLPDRIEILSHPGADRSISMKDHNTGFHEKRNLEDCQIIEAKKHPLPGTFTVPGRGFPLFQNPPKPKKPGSWPL